MFLFSSGSSFWEFDYGFFEGMVRLRGIEPLTNGLEIRCSIR